MENGKWKVENGYVYVITHLMRYRKFLELRSLEVEELRRSYSVHNGTTLPSLAGEGGRRPDGVINENSNSHAVLSTVSQELSYYEIKEPDKNL